MSATAVIAHEQNPATGLLYSLLIDGQDVMGQVPFDSIHVTEAAPGAVSSMSFRILDPSKVVTIADTAFIQAWDYTRDLPVFTGFVQSQDPSPGYGGSGRDIDVTCFGIEAILDQIIVPSLAAMQPAGSFVDSTPTLQAVCQFAPFLRALASGLPGFQPSTQGSPIGSMNNALGFDVAGIVPDGGSVRSTFESWFNASIKQATFLGNSMYGDWRLTVDFYGGVRTFGQGSAPAQNTIQRPSDYADLTIVETPTGIAAATLQFTRDTSPGNVITQVYVKGGNAAGTGWVTGDTTKGRGQGYIDDSTSLTEALKQSIGRSLIGTKGTGSGRGTLTLENYVPTNVHPGSLLVITNAALGWTANQFIVSQIDKTFLMSGRQNWTVSFFDIADAPAGGARSLARRFRSITRTLS